MKTRSLTLLAVLLLAVAPALGCRSNKVKSFDREVGERLARGEPVGLVYLQTRHDGNTMATAVAGGTAGGVGAATGELGYAVAGGLAVGLANAGHEHTQRNRLATDLAYLDQQVGLAIVGGLSGQREFRLRNAGRNPVTPGFDGKPRKAEAVRAYLEQYNLELALGVRLRYTHRDHLDNRVAVSCDWVVYDTSGEPAIRVETWAFSEEKSALLPNTFDPKYASQYIALSREHVDLLLNLLREARGDTSSNYASDH